MKQKNIILGLSLLAVGEASYFLFFKKNKNLLKEPVNNF